MNHDLFALQATLLGRLAGLSTIPVAGMFEALDMSDAGQPVRAQIVMVNFSPAGQAGASARHQWRWSFDLYVDTDRASEAEKTSAMALFSAAMAALIGWEFSPGCFVTSSEGQDSGVDDRRVVRLSFGFTLPAYLVGD